MANRAGNVTQGTDEEWETTVEPYAPTFKFTEGSSITGTLVGSRTVLLDDDNSDDPEAKRDAKLYEIVSDSDGQKYSVWGNYAIDLGMQDVTEGQTVRIIFEGKVPHPKGGGRTVNQMRVMVKK